MRVTPRRLARSVTRIGAAAQNALEIARFGGLGDEESSPYEIVASGVHYRVRRYFPDAPVDGPVVLLVPPLMITAEVWDVAPTTSAVRELHDRGIAPYVCDFGSPEHEEGGLKRTLTDHVVSVSDAVDHVRKVAGRDIHLGGYSQGGMFSYQAGAFRRSEGLRSIVTFGSPVDVAQQIPFGLPAALVTEVVGRAGGVFSRTAIPSWMTRLGFKLMDPVKTVRQRVDFLRQLHDRDALLAREGQRRFLETEGWVAWPGPAMGEFLQQFIAHNRMLSGGFVIDEQLVTLADLTVPTLAFVGDVDELAHPAAVRGIRRAAPRAQHYERIMSSGHFGLVVGSRSVAITWPTVAAWLHWQEGSGPRPEGIVLMDAASDEQAGARAHLRYGAELAVTVGAQTVRTLVGAAERTGRTLAGLTGGAVPLLTRLHRVESIRRGTRISLGLILEEQAGASPTGTFFLFEGRGYTYEAANRRIDNIVRGLISVGIRQGEHVGVLMHTRPTALALVGALNRLGAVVVMLRPDGEIAREMELGRAGRVISDPELAPLAQQAGVPDVLVLGGGGEPRELGFGLTDMERIDPDEVAVPAWYSPNPGRAEDVAYILFSGRQEHIRANRITNRRWAQSAFGMASAARLSGEDTVYNATPIQHPSGLLVGIGGAVAGGARLAMASQFDPGTFWTEVRRYGADVVTYTGTMAHALIEAPADPAEQHHPVRLLLGSGMPRGLWRRVVERFGVGVMEFYASTEDGVILGNLSGEKVGSVGRLLPGSAPVAIAAYQFEAGRLEEQPDGFARPCEVDEVGMLLARVDRERGALPRSPLRGVFARGDAWSPTGALFRRDSEGDYWLVDFLGDVIRTQNGPVFSLPVADALAELDAVGLAIAYGISIEGTRHELPVAAVVLREHGALDPAMLTERVTELLDPASRPVVVRVIPRMPVTTGHRPVKAPLRAEGIEPAAVGDDALWLDPDTGSYVPYEADAFARLGGS